MLGEGRLAHTRELASAGFARLLVGVPAVQAPLLRGWRLLGLGLALEGAHCTGIGALGPIGPKRLRIVHDCV